jgi:hypothetical protein
VNSTTTATISRIWPSVKPATAPRQRAVSHLPASKGDLAQRPPLPHAVYHSTIRRQLRAIVIVEARHLLRYPCVHGIAVVAAVDFVDGVCDTLAGRNISEVLIAFLKSARR